ncbi:MAG: alginate lyase family protein [Candidatus Methylacidiphilales bacterium]
MKQNIYQLILLVALTLSLPAQASTAMVDTYLWDINRINQAVSASADPSSPLHTAREQLIYEAEGALKVPLISVTQKTGMPPSGDKKDFFTLSPYFWPIPFLPGGKPYYFRDGMVNPEANSEIYDRERYFLFMRTVRTLALAYRFSGDERYAQHATRLLRFWFLEPETAMNPHFRHAQVIPGWTDGSSLGVIRGSELVMILDGSRLITSSPSWTSQDEAALRDWYGRYLDWVTTSDFGHRDGKRKNNHGTWHNVHITSVALYTGRDDVARRILEAAPEYRFLKQIKPDGRQTYELRRSRSWEYSLYNLRGLYALAELGDRLGMNLWAYEKDGFNPLLTASTYLEPYASGEETWPHYQLAKSNEWARELAIHLFLRAMRHYGADRFESSLNFLDDLEPSHRLRLLYNHTRGLPATATPPPQTP